MNRSRYLLVAALAFSIAGDWFLTFRNGNDMMFIYGVVMFFVAHAGYLTFSLKNGSIRYLFLLVLLAGYVPFFVIKLAPAISDPVLRITTLAYLLISCLSLAAASGVRLSSTLSQYLFFAGIACFVFSDTLIAFHEFLCKGGWLYDHLMMPAYYATHILIAAAVTHRF